MKYETLTEEELIDRVRTDASGTVKIWNEMAELIDRLEQVTVDRKLAGDALAELTANLLRKAFGQSRESMDDSAGISIEDPLDNNTDVTSEDGSGLSEMLSEDEKPLLPSADDHPDPKVSEELPETETEPTKAPNTSKRSRRNGLKRNFQELYGSLETIIKYYNLEHPDEPVCPKCGGKMTRKEWKLIRKYIEILPVDIHVVEEYAERLECLECDKNEDNTYMTADTPAAVIEGSNTCPATLATFLESKDKLGVPATRYTDFLNSMGCGLSKSTLVDQFNTAGADILAPIVDQMIRDMKIQDIGFCDETILQVLHEKDLEGKMRKPQQTGYVWIFTGLTSDNRAITYYKYAPTRSSKVPDTFLADAAWKYIHTDGYSGYNHLVMIRLLCLAHARRKFYEAIPICGKSTQKKMLLIQEIIVMKFDQIFELERIAADLDPQERLEIRRNQELPILEGILSITRSLKPSKGGKLEKACTYVLNHEVEMKNYTLDARLECSNNRSERSAKTVVLDRRNFLFCNSEKGALAFCNSLSLQTTAEAFGLNPWLYLYTALTFITAWKDDPEKIRMLLPYSDFMQTHCKGPATRERIHEIEKLAEPELIEVTRMRKEKKYQKRQEKEREMMKQVLADYMNTDGIRTADTETSTASAEPKQPKSRKTDKLEAPRSGAAIHTEYDPLGCIRYREIPDDLKGLVETMQQQRTDYLQIVRERKSS